MIRIEKPAAVIVHDGMDVSVVDGIVTIRPFVPLGGYGLGSAISGQHMQQAQGQSLSDRDYAFMQKSQQNLQGK